MRHAASFSCVRSKMSACGQTEERELAGKGPCCGGGPFNHLLFYITDSAICHTFHFRSSRQLQHGGANIGATEVFHDTPYTFTSQTWFPWIYSTPYIILSLFCNGWGVEALMNFGTRLTSINFQHILVSSIISCIL